MPAWMMQLGAREGFRKGKWSQKNLIIQSGLPPRLKTGTEKSVTGFYFHDRIPVFPLEPAGDFHRQTGSRLKMLPGIKKLGDGPPAKTRDNRAGHQIPA